MVGENILDVFLAVPTVVGENILEVFLAVPTVVGENILEGFLILGATGHGCSAEGTDAAPRAHGTGALQASQTYVRPPVAVRIAEGGSKGGGLGGAGAPPSIPNWVPPGFAIFC